MTTPTRARWIAGILAAQKNRDGPEANPSVLSSEQRERLEDVACYGPIPVRAIDLEIARAGVNFTIYDAAEECVEYYPGKGTTNGTGEGIPRSATRA